MAQAVELLRDVGRLLTRSHDLEETLGNVVRLVARWMHAGGCSIYLLEGEGTLVLRATRGLRREAVGQVRLRLGQGIVGVALEGREAVAVPDTRLDERSLPFPQSGEDRFRSMLAVPLVMGALSVGVLTVQSARPRVFSAEEIELLETISAQVASIVMNARLLDLALREGHIDATRPVRPPPPFPKGTILRAIAVSPGIATGPVHLQPPPLDLAALNYQPAASARAEWRAVQSALRQTIRQISDLRATVGERLGEEFAEVFTTHIMILEDQGFREKLERRVFEHANGARALTEVRNEYSALFAATPDPSVRERAADVEDVIGRAIGELVGVRQHNPPLQDGVVVIADRIVPSEFALLETEKVAGMVSAHGGPASHAAIFARSLEIPAVTGLQEGLERIRPSDRVIVDGFEGQLIVNPTPELLEEYQHRAESFRKTRGRLDDLRDLPSRTLDGHEIRLSANIGTLTDLDLASRYGASGVGLFRTEILALSARSFPDEEEQVRVYRNVAERAAPDGVNIRIFDLGGDKARPDGDIQEQNPQLGWRSIRFLLDREEIFATQLRAILRANAPGNIRILIPMLTSMEELDQTWAILKSQVRGLGLSKLPPLGLMIETPAAVAIADRLAPLVDFFAIGTNDLVQYTLAMARENARVAASCDPFHPAVLAQIRRTSDAAKSAGIPVSVCGELAGSPVAVPILIGMGIDELSMTPFSIALTRHVIRTLEMEACQALARDVERCARAKEVRGRLHDFVVETGWLEDRDLGVVVDRLLQLRSVRPGSTPKK
jgi:phosphotransferase system enzyme I (PtsP)